MSAIDQYAMQELFELNEEVMNAYTDYNFTEVFHLLGDYCSVNLSAFYLDIVKDRLYVEKKDGLKRRSAQTVCWTYLDTLTKLMAPILSFTAEQFLMSTKKAKLILFIYNNFPLCAMYGNSWLKDDLCMTHERCSRSLIVRNDV